MMMNEDEVTRVFLLDDHPMMRFGLAHLIRREPGMDVCGEAGTAKEAFDAVSRLKPDVFVLDITLPDRNGLTLLRDVQCLDHVPVSLVISMHDELIYAERALRAGAKGYIMKEHAAQNIITAIRRIMEGKTFVSDEISNRLLSMVTGKAEASGKFSIESLTDRQLEILEHIGLGQSTFDIAERLGISPKTVEAHRARIKLKLGISDGHALMRYAVRWVENQDTSEV